MKIIALFLAPLLVAAASDSTSHVAETIHIEGTAIVIPAPSGYVPVTPQMKQVYAIQREFVAPMNELFLGFIPAESAADALSGQLFDMPRSFTVQTQRKAAKQIISARQFGEMKRAIKTETRQMMEQAEKQMPGLMEKINANLEKQTGVNLGLSAPQMVPFPPHEDTERSIAYSMLVRMDGMDASGKKDTSHGFVTGTFVLARGKILFLYCNGGPKDLEWTRGISKQWSQAVMAANPMHGEGGGKRDGTSFWSRVLRGALIGAAAGAVFGLFRYISSKRKGAGDPS